ncbi:acetate--CoA ligase family protein [Actinomadura rugatobispora]|uniref:Acetate--CoA ligase family protein n=1 Tax=Actinomadura rugatobispora TaxID=1994 RepID=A0ABW1A4S9_9ACTN|nr:acetate--CoA ligase family protein [Actinomadura rugatobispora]
MSGPHALPDLSRLVRPESVVIVGASDKPGGLGTRTVHNLLRASDFDGRTFLVNPRRDEIDGHPCHPDIESLPIAPDVAVIAIPAPGVLDALERCAAKGIAFAIVLTSGFGEVGDEGRAQQERMRRIAADTGMRIYGPNCPGLTNLADRIGMTFSPAFADDKRTGPIGIATQGGGLGRNLVQAAERGAGAALWASLGNAADLDVADFVHHMAGDDGITVIATLLEGVRDGARLMAAFGAAAEAGKPVVALKVGRSEYGVRAIQSHTAALAGSAAVNSAVFAQYGVVEVDDTDELMDVAWLLARAAPPPRTRVAVFGGSGGAAAMAADMVGAAGLELAVFEPATTAALREALPDFAAVGNPVDITAASISEPGLMDRTLGLVAADPNVDLVLLPIPLDYGAHSARGSEVMAAVQKQTATPLLPVWMSDRRGPGFQVLADAGFCSPRSLDKAVLAVRRWADHGRWRAESRAPEPLLLAPSTTEPLPPVRTEPEAKAWLAGAGIAVPEGKVAATADEARTAARELGGRLVLKVVSPDLPHKSDIGGVLVGVEGPDAAAAAWEQIVAAASPHGSVEGVLVERMAPDGVEMLVGVHRDPVYGHLITVGLGGVHVELFGDVQRRLLPLDPQTAREMVDGLRSRPLLDGLRGAPPHDVDALVDLLLAVSDLVTKHAADIGELDLNPVRVLPSGVIVLDALVVP